MDYTSVTNIEKVINPLFMDELEEEFEKSFESDARVRDKNAKRIQNLYALWNRISKIKVFDPACGSGNFLIISYKRLRELELRILDEITTLQGSGFLVKFNSRIRLENFYGIELEDFSRELAVLSMYIAEHQMNMAFEDSYGKKIDMLPITDMPHIVCGNAARLDWGEICPNNGDGEIYLIGNPPYQGSRDQTQDQKSDMKHVLGDIPKYKSLDYVFIWLYKGANYISNSKAKLAFLATNSTTEGEQVSILWPDILDMVQINFAYTSFLWKNNATDQAGVYFVIISLASKSDRPKYIFTDGLAISAKHINAYLADADDVYIKNETTSLALPHEIKRGSEMNDGDRGNNLSVDAAEKERLERIHPSLKGHFRLLANSANVLHGNLTTYGIWLTDLSLDEALKYPELKERISKVAEKRPSNPHLFSRISVPKDDYIFIPQLSSERRKYIPITFLDRDIVPLGPHFYIDGGTLTDFSILSSSMHMSWMRAVSGKFKKDYRYSSELVYNTFPCPPLTSVEKEKLTQSAENILIARENHSEMTLAEMYDPDKMPADLRQAHEENDVLVDKLYRDHAFANDEERLAVLFDLYEKMTNK